MSMTLFALEIKELTALGHGICMACNTTQLTTAGESLQQCKECSQFEVVGIEDALHIGVLDVLGE